MSRREELLEELSRFVGYEVLSVSRYVPPAPFQRKPLRVGPHGVLLPGEVEPVRWVPPPPVWEMEFRDGDETFWRRFGPSSTFRNPRKLNEMLKPERRGMPPFRAEQGHLIVKIMFDIWNPRED